MRGFFLSYITPNVLPKRYADTSAATETACFSLERSCSLTQSRKSAFKKFTAIKAQETPLSLAQLSAEYVNAYVKDLNEFLMWKMFGYEGRSKVHLPEALSCAPIDPKCLSTDFFREFESWRTPCLSFAHPPMSHRLIFDVVKDSIEEINDADSLVYVSGCKSGTLSLHVGGRSERLSITFRNFLSRMDKIVCEKLFPKELDEFLKK
jgi:hypothetical protein